MNNSYENIYDNLMALVEASESFFLKDAELDGVLYRMFNYRLCSYSDFLLPSALECRGIMFEINGKGECIDIASRPMPKFFNDKENPFTENVDYNKTTHIMRKEDGSLISTFMHKGFLRLKTKGSINSDQAVAAMEWLDHSDQKVLQVDTMIFTQTGHTVNMEWTSPENRIVLGYESDSLVILNVRNNFTGEYVPVDKYPVSFSKHTVEDLYTQVDDIDTFVSNIYDERGIEGYVFRLEDGQMIKHKCEWYLNLHRNKESVNSSKKLFEAVINEVADDLLTLFTDDPQSVNIINEMIERVDPIYNHIIASTEAYYKDNKHLSRKEYAIKATGMNDGLMSLYMNMYSDKDNDYKKFALRNFEMFIGE